MKIILAQFFTSNLSYGKYTKAINERYCNDKNYIYHLESDSEKIRNECGDRAITWYKPKFLLDVLAIHNPDYVFFLDADAIVDDESITIDQFIDPNFNIIATEDHGPSKINAGVFILKNTEWTKTFLQKWWDICELHPKYKHGLWHDQTCFGLLYDSSDDSKNNIKIISNRKLNWRYPQDSAFIFHAFGYGDIPNRLIDTAYYSKFNIPFPDNNITLTNLAKFYPTDKDYGHNYLGKVYEKIFKPIQKDTNIFVEIGVGNGNSLKIWKKYFNCERVIGIDNDETILKSKIDGCELLKCDQSIESDLIETSNNINNANIILDDGSHKMYDQQKTFAIFFKALAPGGIYIIENIQTSLECKMPSKSIFGWGDPNKTTTLDMLKGFSEEGVISSDYLTNSEIEYLNKNIEYCTIFDSEIEGMTSVIKKRIVPLSELNLVATSKSKPKINETLSSISMKYPTDKNFTHDYYNKVYEPVFKSIKDEIKLFCEIGIGGFSEPMGWRPGNSLKVWRDYFKNANILGLDIVRHNVDDLERIKIDWLDQSKRDLVNDYAKNLENYDIILDDGSHNVYDQQITFAAFFKSLKPGGIYVIEDLHSSIEVNIPEKAELWGWGVPGHITPLEMLENFKKNGKIISDDLNSEEISYLNENIESVEIFTLSPTSITSVIRKKKNASIELPTEEYKVNSDGVMYQTNSKKFIYDEKYIKDRYDKYGELTNYISYLRLGYVLGSVELEINSILDVGYGNGAFLKACKKIIPNCYGFEVNNYKIPEGIKFVSNWIDKEVDVITFFDVLEHFSDPYIIKDLKTKYIVLSIPWCHYISDDLNYFYKWKHRRPNEHLWFFNESNLKNFAKSTGYEIVKYSNIEDSIRGKLGDKNNILTATLKKI